MSILFISPEHRLLASLQQILPDSISIAYLSTLDDLSAIRLHQQRSTSEKIDLILLHHPDKTALIADCYRLHRTNGIERLPVIALIEQLELRQPALTAGATDYLSLPLLPAEVEHRLGPYLRTPLRAFHSLAGVFSHLKQGSISPHLWETNLKHLADCFGATSAWCLMIDPIQEVVNLVGSYNLPSDLSKAVLEDHTVDWSRSNSRPDGNKLLQIDFERGWVQLPFWGEQSLLGLLTLRYRTVPHFSFFEQETLLGLAQSLGNVLEIHHIHQETQIYATLNAFIVLVARTISEQHSLNSILSQTLEQVIPLLNASGGDIWLLSANGTWLEMVSSLAPPSAFMQTTRRPHDKGLLGWVVQQQQTLISDDPPRDPHFDREVDCFSKAPKYSLLAVPLCHQHKVIGVMTIHNNHGQPFGQRDVVLAEGITSLSAPAIAHAQLLQDLSAYAEQHKILYEMSHQIAAGLELQTTLNRALHWIGRLIEVEISLFWFAEPDEGHLRLLAVSNYDLQPDQQLTTPLQTGILGNVVQQQQPLVLNDPTVVRQFKMEMPPFLKVRPQTLMALPIIYHGQIIGVLCLFNKEGGPFDRADQTLLSTALEMIAVAVGNARLHTHTITLMKERERLQRQFLQAERLATVGRLTASLSHEINNPMQAIRGALSLALEEVNDPQEVTSYLELCLTESERVVKLIHHLRQIYRPPQERIEALDINRLLEDVVLLAQKELKRQKVQLKIDLSAKLPRMTAIASQLQLVFLNLLLNLSDHLSSADGAELRLSSRYRALTGTILIEFATDQTIMAMAEWMNVFQTASAEGGEELSFGLSLSQDILLAHAGKISFEQREQDLICRIELQQSALF